MAFVSSLIKFHDLRVVTCRRFIQENVQFRDSDGFYWQLKLFDFTLASRFNPFTWRFNSICKHGWWIENGNWHEILSLNVINYGLFDPIANVIFELYIRYNQTHKNRFMVEMCRVNEMKKLKRFSMSLAICSQSISPKKTFRQTFFVCLFFTVACFYFDTSVHQLNVLNTGDAMLPYIVRN